MAAPPFFLTPSRASLAPRIHYRLPCDIRHRYRRYRPGDLHRPGGRCGPSYGSYGQLAAGYLVDDPLDAYHGVFQYNQGSYFSMAEEKPDNQFSDADQGSEMSSTTTPEAYVAEDSIEDEAPIPRTPNSAVLVLSWGVFSLGLYFFYAAAMGYYQGAVAESKLAVITLVAILTFRIGVFLRRSAYHGFRQAFIDFLSRYDIGSG